MVVKKEVLKNSELDEPLDVILYMIIAALGFAALENILKFLSPEMFNLGFQKTLIMTGFIFISSTFLHALASGLFGYFLALSFFEARKKRYYFVLGLLTATLWHGFYNFSIINMMREKNLIFAIVVIFILTSAAIIVSLGFQRLKKIKSICKI